VPSFRKPGRPKRPGGAARPGVRAGLDLLAPPGHQGWLRRQGGARRLRPAAGRRGQRRQEGL